jgi:hypothetical protein
LQSDSGAARLDANASAGCEVRPRPDLVKIEPDLPPAARRTGGLMNRHQLVVLSKARPGKEAEFEAWYDQQHIPDALRIPGVVSAKRLEVSRVTSNGPTEAWTCLVTYEIESHEPETVMAEIRQRAGTGLMPISDALDRDTLLYVVATHVLEVSAASAS